MPQFNSFDTPWQDFGTIYSVSIRTKILVTGIELVCKNCQANEEFLSFHI